MVVLFSHRCIFCRRFTDVPRSALNTSYVIGKGFLSFKRVCSECAEAEFIEDKDDLCPVWREYYDSMGLPKEEAA